MINRGFFRFSLFDITTTSIDPPTVSINSVIRLLNVLTFTKTSAIARRISDDLTYDTLE